MKKDIAILYNNEEDERTYKGFNNKNYTKTLKGVQVLLQKITKLLLTPVGTDMYNKSIGTTLSSLLSEGSDYDIHNLESKVLEIIGDLENFIKKEQASDINLDDSERLVSIEVNDVKITSGGTEILIELLVLTSDNSTYFIRI